MKDWDVSKVTNMNYMFYNCVDFKQDISKWDVSKVTSMHRMFEHSKLFNSDISDWEVGNVEDMEEMFTGCRSFNQSLAKWDTSGLTRSGIPKINPQEAPDNIQKMDLKVGGDGTTTGDDEEDSGDFDA